VKGDKEGFEGSLAICGTIQEQQNALGGEGIGNCALVVLRLSQRVNGTVECDLRGLVDFLGDERLGWNLSKGRKRYRASEDQDQQSPFHCRVPLRVQRRIRIRLRRTFGA
jgi:hypothetical protein